MRVLFFERGAWCFGLMSATPERPCNDIPRLDASLGEPLNQPRREMSLQLRHRTPECKVKAKPRNDRTEPRGRNDAWAMDFFHDQLFNGRKIRVGQGPEFVSKDLDLWA